MPASVHSTTVKALLNLLNGWKSNGGFGAWLASILRSASVAALFLGGAAAIATGIWWIYPPAALIFAGSASILIAFALAK